MSKENRHVAIVGVGLVGRAWAAIFARAGWNVRLSDPHAPTLAAAPGLIHDELRALARHDPVTLLFGARDEAHNDAVVLREVLLKP